MNTEPTNMLDFVKAMSDVDRLRIIGALSQGPLNASQIAATVHLPFRQAIKHLTFLSFVGVVLAHAAEKGQDEVYELDIQYLDKLARHQFEGQRPAYSPPDDAEESQRRVLAAHLNPDGSIKQIPLQPAKLRVILDYLINAFNVGANYSEKEVNMILARFHADTAGLRRDLIDAGMLERERDGSRYWKPEGN
jgi:hypothetical protein